MSGSVPTGEPEALLTSLGRYEVLGAIASGGMATVYLARVTGLAGFEREVAVKVTHAHLRDEPDFVTSLMDEARLAGRLRHQNIVSVLDVDVSPAGVFIVMDYVDGESLARIERAMRKQELKVPLKVALRIVDDTLAGLHAAHELKDAEGRPFDLVHRDVTPHNILLATDGVARLADFGIAKAASRLGNTSTGLIKGKAPYMSPEQARGEPIDRRADVWAAGVVAWELITGKRLYEGTNDSAILFKVTRERPMRVRHLCPEVPREVDDAVAKALEPDLDLRFGTAEAFADALSRAAEQHGHKADHREVGRFFAPILAPLLEKRRARVREVAGLRRPGDPALRSNPTHPIPVADVAAMLTPTVRSSPAAAANDLAETTQSGTGSASALDAQVFPGKPRSFWVGAAVAAGVLVVIAAVAFWGSSSGQGPKQPEAPAAGSPRREPEKATAGPALEPPPGATAPDASAAKGETSEPPPKRRPQRVQPDENEPLSNPYKGTK